MLLIVSLPVIDIAVRVTVEIDLIAEVWGWWHWILISLSVFGLIIPKQQDP